MTSSSMEHALPPDAVQRRPACISCSKAKRRCSKQIPACTRCRGKRHPCVYPLTHIVLSSSEHVYPQSRAAVDTTSPDSDVSTLLDQASTLPPTVAAPRRLAHHRHNHHRSGHHHRRQQRLEPLARMQNADSPLETPSASAAAAALPTPPTADHSSDAIRDLWFLTRDSWQIYPSPSNNDTITYPNSGLEAFVAAVKGWLDHWIDQGHCALIHPRLYGEGHLPDCLRDAHAAYNTYRTATPLNKGVAMQVVGGSSRRLVEGEALFDDLDYEALDLRSHLSRTQALLVYQVIRYFDGDIRSRADAEAASDTLVKWSSHLMQRAASTSAAAATATATAQQSDSQDFPHDDAQQEQRHHSLQKGRKTAPDPCAATLQAGGTLVSTWRTWILSECIRRAWIVATLAECAFAILKSGVAACPGDVFFTSRAGLWEALSPREWLARLPGAEERRITSSGTGRGSPVDGFPLMCSEVPGLLAKNRPEQVDDFTHALIVYGAGQEEWDDWMTGEEGV